MPVILPPAAHRPGPRKPNRHLSAGQREQEQALGGRRRPVYPRSQVSREAWSARMRSWPARRRDDNTRSTRLMRRDLLSRDRLAVLAALVAPVAVAAILVPFRSSFPNTDAALAMILVVVAVAANGYRLAGILAARVDGGVVRFLPHPALRDLFHHPADRHRDDRAAAGDRRRGHRDSRLGAPPARDREQAGGLSRRNQQRRAGGGGRGIGVGADRAGDQPAHPVALAAVVQLPVRDRRARPARAAAARRFGHHRAAGLECGRRGVPGRYGHGAAGGERRSCSRAGS